MSQNLRICIATVTAGGGHLAAAAALEEAWRTLCPGDRVERLDVLKFALPINRKIHSRGYVGLVERAPELWGLLFDHTDRPQTARVLSRLKRALPSFSRRGFSNHLRRFKPDVVLCTHYLPLETLGKLRASNSRPLHPYTVSVVTDFEAHALWMDACVDLYCVAAEETRARLLARGAIPECVLVTGIPVSARFSGHINTKAVRRKFGWRDDLPILLVLSGGFGMGPVKDILSELDKAPGEFQLVVVTGRNEELRRELCLQNRVHPTHVLGFASNMHELMAVAQLIITKPGGLTSSEALAIGKPLFILNPIPGQEAANSDFLLEHGAASKVNRVEDLPFRIGQLLKSKKLLDMARAAKALGQPDAAQQVCRIVMDKMPATKTKRSRV